MACLCNRPPMCVNVSDSWWGVFLLFSHQQCICRRGPSIAFVVVSLQSILSGCGVFALVLTGSGVTIRVLVLLWTRVTALSDGDAVTTFMRMLEAIALFSGTSTNLDRQSAALLQAPEIHSKVISS